MTVIYHTTALIVPKRFTPTQEKSNDRLCIVSSYFLPSFLHSERRKSKLNCMITVRFRNKTNFLVLLNNIIYSMKTNRECGSLCSYLVISYLCITTVINITLKLNEMFDISYHFIALHYALWTNNKVSLNLFIQSILSLLYGSIYIVMTLVYI